MKDAAKLQSLFNALSDANRLLIIRLIGARRLSVSEIVAGLKLSQPLVSHHLKVLRELAVLKTRREGPFIYYELSDARILDALGIFSEIAVHAGENCCSPALRMFCCPGWFKKMQPQAE